MQKVMGIIILMFGVSTLSIDLVLGVIHIFQVYQIVHLIRGDLIYQKLLQVDELV